MSKKDSGDFFGDMIKLWGAVQASKGSDGKPDPYKAAGIAAGLGHTSPSDIAMLGGMLGSQGAFRDDNSSSGYVGGGGSSSFDDSWRDFCEDGSDYDLDPEDFDSEEEYEEALEEAKEKYAWRENCEDGFEYNIDPEDYETEEEYLEALNEEKYAWRETCEDGSEYCIDPEDYDTEEEYLEDLNEEKYAWRESCDPEENLDPEDYETEEDYRNALLEAEYEDIYQNAIKEKSKIYDNSWRSKYYGADNPSPNDYTTEEEYLKAVEQEFDENDIDIDNSYSYDWRESFDKIENYGINPKDFENKEDFIHARATAAVVKSAELRANAARDSIIINEETLSDKNEYIYCGVMYEGNDFTYHYLTDDESIKIGDTVIVPVGSTNEETTATVVSVGKYLRVAAPYPVEKTKKIIRKE